MSDAEHHYKFRRMPNRNRQNVNRHIHRILMICLDKLSHTFNTFNLWEILKEYKGE